MIYNRLDRTPEEKMFGSPAGNRIWASWPACRWPSGFLSGKYKPGKAFGIEMCEPGRIERPWIRNFATWKRFAARKCRPARTWPSGRWRGALQHPAVTGVIPGCKKWNRSAPTRGRRSWQWCERTIRRRGNGRDPNSSAWT